MNTSVAVQQKRKETQVKPTRVQPSRKAKGGPRAATQGELGKNARGRKAAKRNTKIEEIIQRRKTNLQLHRKWSTFKAHLEAIIGDKPQGEESRGSDY